MQRIISMCCAMALACSSGFVIAGTSAADSNHADGKAKSRNKDTVSGDAGVVTPSDTNRGVGSVGNDQETRAGQNNQEGVNTGTRTVPSDSNKNY